MNAVHTYFLNLYKYQTPLDILCLPRNNLL